VNAPVQLPLPVELIAIGIGAMYGTLSAVKERLAISGVVALAVVLGLGGGLIRDTLIQRGTPVAFTTPSYLLTAVTVGVIAVLLAGSLVRMRFLLDGLDALSFALFAVLGADKALLAGIPVLGAMLIGELTGTGGSVLHDTLLGRPAELLRPGRLLGVAAAPGLLLYPVAAEAGGQRWTFFVIATAVITIIRLGAVYPGWEVGPAATITERSDRIMRRSGAAAREALTRQRRRTSLARRDDGTVPEPPPADPVG